MTLLDRLDGVAVGAACVRGGLMSVLRNVGHVLNTRRGSAPAQMDLGTPPPSELMRGDRPLIERMQRSIGQAIERYEPRLVGVRVTLEPSAEESFLLRFRVRARLADSGEEVGFRTLVDPVGRLSVKP
jgi:type VI secretion system protein